MENGKTEREEQTESVPEGKTCVKRLFDLLEAKVLVSTTHSYDNCVIGSVC